MRRNPIDRLSDTSRVIILIAVIVIAVALLAFFIIRPIKPDLEPSGGFGTPGRTQPAPAPAGGG